MEKFYYWAEGLDDYNADNEANHDKIIEIKRLNFYIGRNNAGKSTFLRNLFQSSKNISNYSPSELKIETENLFNTAQRVTAGFSKGNTFSNSHKTDLLNNIKSIINLNESNPENRALFLSEKISEIEKYNIEDHKKQFQKIKEVLLEKYRGHLRRVNFNAKFYIPVLRGMRPTSEDSKIFPYINRTIKDYFNTKIDLASLITGERLYEELSRCLLGKPDQRRSIRSYEQNLSRYFFDNQEISLNPEYDKDLVSIKIGNDDQFPISKLGDGLQQAIILTYEAFVKKDETHAFFIEEPELHMHPGMLRQLMNFYLNETPHYYFFTTHSNHLLDMVDESDDVIIQKFTKKPDGKFQINRCDKDRDLLAALGVKPSSVYLANCTIWVEGITDRLYIAKYMQQYLEELEEYDEELYIKYRRFMPNYHYAFVEYAGGNIAHWSFDEVAADQEADRGLTAKRIASDMLLIVDGDNEGKADRVQTLAKELGDKSFHIFTCKEIENTLPASILIATAKNKFSRMKTDTTDGFDITLLDSNAVLPDFNHATDGIGRILDNAIRQPSSAQTKNCFGESSGTIKDKLGFCRLALNMMEQEGWQLTDSAKALCEKIFQHIESCNKT